MANLVFNRGYALVPLINTTASVLQVMLVSTSYAANPDHTWLGNNSSSGAAGEPKFWEISVGGYARQTLANMALFQDNTNDFAGLDATDVTFSALVAGQTVGGAVLYRYSSAAGSTGLAATTGDSGQELIAFYALTATPTNGGDIVISWASTSAGSVLKFASTS